MSSDGFGLRGNNLLVAVERRGAHRGHAAHLHGERD
jgi:hypothetical protein